MPGRWHQLRIAILGTRGVPAKYGGFETFAEEMGSRLAERGHDVTVYSRTRTVGTRRYRGMRIIGLPAIRTKSLETLSHTALSVLHAAIQNYDIVYVCNSANAPLCYVPHLRGQRVLLNVDGLEWQRAKWGPIARAYYRWASSLAARMPIEVITDAHEIQRYYREELNRETLCIAYGTGIYARGYGSGRLESMGLRPDQYVLYVARMEPENNARLVAEAFAKVATPFPLVMVGDAPYAKAYIESVRAVADERVRFLGYRFGDEYHALQANALVYVQASEVGGTHPALVEAMGHQNAILAHDTPEHREVLGDEGAYFRRRDSSDLASKLQAFLDDPLLREATRLRAVQRVRTIYDWDAIVDEYERLFLSPRPRGKQ